MNAWKLTDAEAQLLATQVLGLLNGLCVAEAQWVLQQADTMLLNTHRVDTDSPLFSECLEELRRASAEQA